MSAPFRISARRRVQKTSGGGGDGSQGFNSYLERLVKMIPAEVIGLYLVGSGMIPADNAPVLVCWTVFCAIVVIISRGYGTSDPAKNLPPDWKHVAISFIAFFIWVYSMGGPFAAYKIYVSYIGSLMVLAYTVIIPMIYKGPEA